MKTSISLWVLLMSSFGVLSLSAQPLATPKELGMEQQYFARLGLGASWFLSAFDGSNSFRIDPDETDLEATAELPEVGVQAIYRVGLGSRLDQHHFALDLGYAPIGKGYYEFAIDYQYQFGDRNWRPSLVLGLDYMQVDYEDVVDFGGRRPDAGFSGKGFHLGAGYNFYNNHIGWENRAVIRAMSVDNVFIYNQRYQVSGLTVTWNPSIESYFIVFF